MNGQPVGNLKLGRRFSQTETDLIRAGADLKTLVACAPKIQTRAEMYAELFAAAVDLGPVLVSGCGGCNAKGSDPAFVL